MKDRRSKEHKFNIEDAKDYGVECAVILSNIRHWLDKNIANGKNIEDGRVWTYNSTKAFSDMFPYLTQKQIYLRLKKLEEVGILLTGNYNKHNYDQTKWYSINEDYYTVSKPDKSNFPKEKTHFPISENGDSHSGKPIPDIKPNKKPDDNSYHQNQKNRIPDLNSEDPNATVEMSKEAILRKKFMDKVGSEFASPDEAFEYMNYCVYQMTDFWNHLKRQWGISRASRQKIVNATKEFSTWAYSKRVKAKPPKTMLPMLKSFMKEIDVREYKLVN